MLGTVIYGFIIGTLLAGIAMLMREDEKRKRLRRMRWRLLKSKEESLLVLPLRCFEKARGVRRQERLEGALAEVLSHLRNLVILGNGRAMGADGMLEQLVDAKGALSGTFAKMLYLIRQRQPEEAERVFRESVGSKEAAVFARLLIRWDELDPALLIETLLSVQKNLTEKRITAQKKRDEWMSELIYLPVVINTSLVFLNFIYVGYFIDQKEMLTMLM